MIFIGQFIILRRRIFYMMNNLEIIQILSNAEPYHPIYIRDNKDREYKLEGIYLDNGFVEIKIKELEE